MTGLHRCTRCNEEKPEREFYESGSRSGPRPWCKSCFGLWHRARYVPKNGATDDPRDCACCGVTYQPKQRRSSVFCSRGCKDAFRYERARADRETSKPERSCVHCGRALSRSMRSDARFCSELCNSAAHAVTRKMGKRVGDRPGLVSRAALAERDRWRCRLCGGGVAKWRRHPDPLSPSIDHRRPVSSGGGNEVENLQLAHLVCNLRKAGSMQGVRV